MLEMADVRPGKRVLDVAAGAGDQTLDIAKRVGPAGYVLAADLSPCILEFCRENALGAGHDNVDTLTADGETLQVEDASFDAAICRLGLMFLDPGEGLRAHSRSAQTRW
jgi:ubiquinone/menaquinone biosynthesis C-methylase UbiE